MPTIAENLQRLVDAKTAIGNAITAKGGTVGQGDGLEEFVSAIAGIPTSTVEIIKLTPNFRSSICDVYMMNLTDSETVIFGEFASSANESNVSFTYDITKFSPKKLISLGGGLCIKSSSGYSSNLNYIKTYYQAIDTNAGTVSVQLMSGTSTKSPRLFIMICTN